MNLKDRNFRRLLTDLLTLGSNSKSDVLEKCITKKLDNTLYMYNNELEKICNSLMTKNSISTLKCMTRNMKEGEN